MAKETWNTVLGWRDAQDLRNPEGTDHKRGAEKTPKRGREEEATVGESRRPRWQEGPESGHVLAREGRPERGKTWALSLLGAALPVEIMICRHRPWGSWGLKHSWSELKTVGSSLAAALMSPGVGFRRLPGLAPGEALWMGPGQD